MLVVFLVFVFLALMLMMFLSVVFASDETVLYLTRRVGCCKAEQRKKDEEDCCESHFDSIFCILETEHETAREVVIDFCSPEQYQGR